MGASCRDGVVRSIAGGARLHLPENLGSVPMIDGRWSLRRSTEIQCCRQFDESQGSGRGLVLIEHSQTDVSMHGWR